MRQTNVIKLDQRSQSFSSGCKSATDQNLSKSATGKQRYRSVSIAPLMSIYEEDVSNSSVIKSSCPVIAQYPPEKQNQQSEVRKITKKHSLPKTESRSNESVFNENRDDYEKRKTIIWPPLPKKSVVSIHRVPKSIVDPERIDEYRRQKEIELMAIRMNQEKYLNSLQKQIISAERQLCAVVLEESETDMDEIAEEYSNLSLADIGRTVGNISDRKTKLRSCRRRNIIERQKPVVRNEIINSEQLLLREKIDVDILKLRENFIQKPTARIEIQRTGKSWKPPPEPQYILPIMQPTTNSPGCSGAEENHEHEWRAAIYDPELKNEHESFTPPNSPDPFLIKGSGTGSLDKAARRQIKYLVKPTSNGAHRPKNLFGGPRSTPAGGFYPHAPNAVKVIRKTDGHGKTVFLKLENRKLLSGSGMNDMQRHTSPVHTSTISDRVMPRCVDIRKRCLAFEREAKKLSDAGPRIWKSSDCSRKNSSNSQNHVYDDIVKSRKPSNSCTNGNQPVAANRKSSYRATRNVEHINATRSSSNQSDCSSDVKLHHIFVAE